MSVQDVYLISTLAPVSVSCIVSMVAHTPDIISFAGEFSFARSSIWKWYVLKHLFAFGSLPSKEEEKRQKKQSFVLCHPSTSCGRFQPKSTSLFCLLLVFSVCQSNYWGKEISDSSLSRRLILSVGMDQENSNKTPYYVLTITIWVMISMLL